MEAKCAEEFSVRGIPVAQKERWFAPGGGQSGGGTLSLASNLVIQTLNSGRMKAFTADKGEELLAWCCPSPPALDHR
jgi:hypothetical protein